MVVIYCVEDINDLKYVGHTKMTLSQRLSSHKCGLRKGECSSCKLNLYNSVIYELETCSSKNKKERERYWINKIDCVNINKLNGLDVKRKTIQQKEFAKEYRQRADVKERHKLRQREYMVRLKHKNNI
tara:strand:+ start:248 stop:631 length:384 start_codon:yes stop_codon:yes gene_type:complete